jgi:hypothetical protein
VVADDAPIYELASPTHTNVAADTPVLIAEPPAPTQDPLSSLVSVGSRLSAASAASDASVRYIDVAIDEVRLPVGVWVYVCGRCVRGCARCGRVRRGDVGMCICVHVCL